MESTATWPTPEFGPFIDGDEVGLSALVSRTTPARRGLRLRDMSPAYYRWMYMQNPAGRAIAYSARARGLMVASSAIAPKVFAIDGERVMVGKTMDIFTDPAWQGHGLMGRLSRTVFERAVAAGIKGWYVAPSSESYPIFAAKWGYREEFSLTYRFRPLGPQWLRGRQRLPAGVAFDDTSRFDREADDLWKVVSHGYRVAQVRDSEYLNWRYVTNPDRYDLLCLRRQGRLSGIAVLGQTVRRGIATGELMDVIYERRDEDSLRLLVNAAATRAAHHGCRLLQAWSVPATQCDSELRRAGMRWRRGEIKFLLSPGFPGATSDDPDTWMLSQGDVDRD